MCWLNLRFLSEKRPSFAQHIGLLNDLLAILTAPFDVQLILFWKLCLTKFISGLNNIDKVQGAVVYNWKPLFY